MVKEQNVFVGEPNRLDSLGPPGEVKNQDHFSYAEETKLAWEEGKLSKDIMEEQRKLTQADLVIFQVPLFSPSCDYSFLQAFAFWAKYCPYISLNVRSSGFIFWVTSASVPSFPCTGSQSLAS